MIEFVALTNEGRHFSKHRPIRISDCGPDGRLRLDEWWFVKAKAVSMLMGAPASKETDAALGADIGVAGIAPPVGAEPI